MDRITTTIKREWLSEIIEGTKKIEYREIKQYWEDKLAKVSIPFELRLINGMQQKAPEVTVLIKKVRRDTKNNRFELNVEKILNYKHWDANKKHPK
jgi:hypothetical protein